MISRVAIRRILLFTMVTSAALAAVFSIHQAILESYSLVVQFSVLNVYLFHAVAAIVVYITIEFIYARLPTQAGLFFLVGIMVKGGFFFLMFYKEFAMLDQMEMFEKYALLIPLFLFLLIEIIFLSKLLNSYHQ